MKYIRLLTLLVISLIVLFSSPSNGTNLKKRNQSTAMILGILPFKNNASSEYKWLSTGLSDTFIAKYSGVKGIKLVEREKLLELRNSSEPDKELATKIGTDYLLVGSYSINGADIRISARLISSASAEVFRDSSHTVTGELDEIFTLQTKLARDIANECSLTVPKTRIQYTEGKTVDAHKVFNQGKALYYKAVNNLGKVDVKLLQKSLSLFNKAQKLNNGSFFAEAHSWEGRAYQALAKSAKKSTARKKIIAKQIKKFRADAAEAAPAFYDLGVAYQSINDYSKARNSYNDYLTWIEDEAKPVISQIKARSPSFLKLNSYTDSLKTFHDLRFGIIDGPNIVYLQKSKRARYELVSYNPHTLKTNWTTELKGSRRQRYDSGAQANVTIAATYDLFFLFVDDVIFMVDRNTGELKGKSPSIKAPKRTVSYADRTIYLDPQNKTGIILVVYLDNSNRKRVRRCAYQFSYKSKRIKTKEVYKASWNGIRGNRSVLSFLSKEENGVVYFYDRTLERDKHTIALSLKNGTQIESDQKSNHWMPASRIQKRFDAEGIYFSVKNKKVQKYDASNDELLWQYKLHKSPRFVGVYKGDPLIYEYKDQTYTLYNSQTEAKLARNHAKALVNKAICLIRQEEYSEALAPLRQALAVDLTQREAYYWLGIAYSNINTSDMETLYALVSFDRYSNEAINDPKRSKEVYDYLKEHGGISQKTTYIQKSNITCTSHSTETMDAPYLSRYFRDNGFSIFSPEAKKLYNLNKKTRYFDDAYSYSKTNKFIRVTDYVNKETVAEIYLDDQVLSWCVDNKKIAVLTDTEGGALLSHYDPESGECEWSLNLPKRYSDNTAFRIFFKEKQILITTDNKLNIENYLIMIDCATQAIRWEKRVDPNLIYPHGTNNVFKSDLCSVLFNGEKVFYSGIYSGKVLIIDAKSGYVNTETTNACVVAFREYIPGKVVAFMHINLQCTCHGNIKQNHDTLPWKIQTSFLRDELRHRSENYKNAPTRISRALSPGSRHRNSEIRYWADTCNNELIIYSMGYSSFHKMNTNTGKIERRFYLPFSYPVSLFKNKEHLYLSAGSSYHSAGKDLTNVYKFESSDLPPNWMSWKMFNDPTELKPTLD